jgi:hypothetical protein
VHRPMYRPPSSHPGYRPPNYRPPASTKPGYRPPATTLPTKPATPSRPRSHYTPQRDSSCTKWDSSRAKPTQRSTHPTGADCQTGTPAAHNKVGAPEPACASEPSRTSRRPKPGETSIATPLAERRVGSAAVGKSVPTLKTSSQAKPPSPSGMFRKASTGYPLSFQAQFAVQRRQQTLCHLVATEVSRSWLTLWLEFRRLRYCRDCGRL